MMAPGFHNGFPFPIYEAVGTWDGTDFTADQTKVCGPGTRYPVGMSIQQMAELYWRAKAFKLTSSVATSSYGVADFSNTTFPDMDYAELNTPAANLEYYQIGQEDPSDVPQLYPDGQLDDDVPWVLVLPVYQVNDTGPISNTEQDGMIPGSGDPWQMVSGASPLELRLFEYGALYSGTMYYPSIELTLKPSAGGPVVGAIGLSSSTEEIP
jgi:hypothetical protein